jgi:hypothetical protein
MVVVINAEMGILLATVAEILRPRAFFWADEGGSRGSALFFFLPFRERLF